MGGGTEDLANIDLFGTIVVGNNVQIGSNAIILPGVNIGDNVIIGAGSIVTKDVPNNTVVAGIPARAIESLEEYYLKHKEDFVPTKNFPRNEKKKFLLSRYNLES